MQDLIAALNAAMGDTGLGEDRATVRRVQQLMRSYVSQSQDWAQYAVYHEGTRYTRNLVDDGNGKYNLLILVWAEGQASPIHDHAGSHCMMKLLAGQLDEQLYAWPSSGPDGQGESLRLRRTAALKANSVAYMHDKLGLHRIANPSLSSKAVSLHLYSPPYSFCKTFDEQTGAAVASRCAAERLTCPGTSINSLPATYTCSATEPSLAGQAQASAITSM
ncbi:hypothetical protein H4R18_005920 [Coemansia javaensis]|uniref:Cysteine dioxygenase n=1 Tax=Coemansia javaensis TaxID=2761396 RepID=A0A9W8H0H6_9FUNG|nr:hypothetical protein H4R18_005920 [Coemansia javaensis]